MKAHTKCVPYCLFQTRRKYRMWKYIVKRLAMAVATLFAILFILYCLLEFMPGSPFNELELTEQQMAQLYARYGLDKPFFQRFFIYVGNMLRGDFGVSYNIQQDYPVTKLVASKFGVSARLGLTAVVIGAIIGIILGMVAAIKKNTWLDTLTTFISVTGVSLPGYVFALALSYIIGYKMKALPLIYSTKHPVVSCIMPVIALAMGPIASIARYTRTEMLEVLDSDYMLLARTKGLGMGTIFVKHALKNGLTPIITVIGPMLVGMMSGSVVVEQIFSVPGMGNLMVTAIQSNDYNVVLALAFLYSAMFIVSMLVVDILYGVVDPRIRVAKGNGNE